MHPVNSIICRILLCSIDFRKYLTCDAVNLSFLTCQLLLLRNVVEILVNNPIKGPIFLKCLWINRDRQNIPRVQMVSYTKHTPSKKEQGRQRAQEYKILHLRCDKKAVATVDGLPHLSQCPIVSP